MGVGVTAPIYTRGRALATRQLGLPPQGKGAPLTLRRVTAGGDYVPGGGESAPTVTEYAGSGIRTRYDLKDVDGTLVQASDVKFIVSPVMQDGQGLPEPRTGDTIVFGGTTYNIVSCHPWQYDGDVFVGFTVQGRA